MAREETLYRKKAANWIDWPDVQRTRIAVIKAYNEAPQAQKAGILKDVVIILLHSVTPPDRVGYAQLASSPPFPLLSCPICDGRVIRKLRWNLSLKREGDDFVIDTTQQRHSEHNRCLGTARNHSEPGRLARVQRRASSMVSIECTQLRIRHTQLRIHVRRSNQDHGEQTGPAVAQAHDCAAAIRVPSARAAISVVGG